MCDPRSKDWGVPSISLETGSEAMNNVWHCPGSLLVVCGRLLSFPYFSCVLMFKRKRSLALGVVTSHSKQIT